jgi:hypothetical protein
VYFVLLLKIALYCGFIVKIDYSAAIHDGPAALRWLAGWSPQGFRLFEDGANEIGIKSFPWDRRSLWRTPKASPVSGYLVD